jgi:death-on-curing protein
LSTSTWSTTSPSPRKLTGLQAPTLQRVTKIELAESALHAPAAGFGETEFYPDFVGKAAVLLVRLAKNHPLPDGNKRAAWVSLRLFIEINHWARRTTPTVDEAEQAVLAVQRARGARATRPHGCAATWCRPLKKSQRDRLSHLLRRASASSCYPRSR